MKITCHAIWGLWDEKPLPAEYRDNITQWRMRLGDGFRIKIWEKHDIDIFLESRPTWSQWITNYSKPIQKCDILRIMLLYTFGGIYLDLDTRPDSDHSETFFIQLIQDKLASGYCILGVEHPYRMIQKKDAWWVEDLRPQRRHRTGNFLPAIRKGQPEVIPRIANYWMAASPRHPFLLQVLSLAWDRRNIRVVKDYDVLYTTGPDIVSMAYRESMSDELISVFVIEYKQFRKMVQHHSWGTWRKKKKNLTLR
jgi:mannosyltransferase OCH1-like enzyme